MSDKKSIVQTARDKGWTVNGPGDDGMYLFQKGYLKIFVQTYEGRFWSAKMFHSEANVTLEQLKEFIER